jgi:diacylglycerol kinase (ATP)
MDLSKLSWKERKKSFTYAVRGVWTVLRTQPNTWIMLAATVAVILAAIGFRVHAVEWCLLLTAIFLIWIAETFNTAVEFLTDLVTQGHHDLARKAKDVSAAAVLLAAIFAAITAALIFVPRISSLVLKAE